MSDKKDTKGNYPLTLIVFLVGVVTGLFIMFLTFKGIYINKTTSTIAGDSQTMEAKDGKTVFKAGEDFDAGRYSVSTSADEAIIFIRDETGNKIASEVIGRKEGTLHTYPVTFNEGMSIKFMNAEEFTLTSLHNESTATLSAGLYTVGVDIDLTPGEYKYDFSSDGSLFVINEDGSQQGVFSDSEESDPVTIEYGDKIHVAITDGVTLSLVSE